MAASGLCADESRRLEAIIRRRLGWQAGDLEVWLDSGRLILNGHATCGFARRLAEEVAARLTGLPVDNRMAFS